jgi:hypothetical protein
MALWCTKLIGTVASTTELLVASLALHRSFASDASCLVVQPMAALAAKCGARILGRLRKLCAATAAVCPGVGYRHAAPVVCSDKAKKPFARNE